ncbi:MAG TPA: flagellar transcriptional regulator FlhD [Paraburkholderia sp.]
MEHDTHRLIHEINLAYLLLTRRLLAEDKASGMSSLGVSSEVADVLLALSPEEIERLASTSQILCSFRFLDHTVLSTLTHSQVEIAAMARSPA